MSAGDATFRGDWPPTGDQEQPAAGRCVVYLAFGSNGRVLYVGKTDDFRRRMAQHAQKSAWPEVCVTWSCIDYGTDRATMDREEVELIRTLAPPFNEQHMPKGAAKLRRQARTLATRWPTDRLVDDWRALLVETVTAAVVLLLGVVGALYIVTWYGFRGVQAVGSGASIVYGWAILKVCARLVGVRFKAGRVNRERAREDRAEINAELVHG